MVAPRRRGLLCYSKAGHPRASGPAVSVLRLPAQQPGARLPRPPTGAAIWAPPPDQLDEAGRLPRLLESGWGPAAPGGCARGGWRGERRARGGRGDPDEGCWRGDGVHGRQCLRHHFRVCVCAITTIIASVSGSGPGPGWLFRVDDDVSPIHILSPTLGIVQNMLCHNV